MIESKALSKKVLASLLTMSCVYLGGTSGLPTAEAGDYIYKYYLNGTGNFSPDVDGGRGNLVFYNWSRFKELKEANAGTDAYKDLATDLIGASSATDDKVQNYMQLTQAVEDIVLTSKDGNYNGNRDVKIDFGSNNFTIQGFDNIYGELLHLGNVGHAGTLSGTGTLKLKHDAALNSDFALLKVGMNSLNPGEKLTIDMGKFIIDGKTSNSGGFNGINIDGYSLGDRSKTHDDLTVNCSTNIKMENTGSGTVRGIYVQDHYGTKASERFQDLTIHVSGVKETQGIRILGGKMDDLRSENLLDITGTADVTSISTSGTVYNLSTKIMDGGANKVNFHKAAYLASYSVNGGAYGLYFSALGNGEDEINFKDTAVVTVSGEKQSSGSWLVASDSARQRVDFAKAAGFEVQTQNANAYGIMATATSTAAASGATNNYNFDGAAVIKAASETKDALAVWIKATGQDALNKVDFNNGLTIIGSADNGRVTGLHAQSSDAAQSIINVHGETAIITDGDDNDYVAQVYGAGTAVNVNQNGGSKVRGLGHIYAGIGAKINWNMDTAGSGLEGWLQSSSGGAVNLTANGSQVVFEGASHFLDPDGIINVDLKNAALWKMVDTSELTDLQMTSDAALDMRADGNAYSTLTTESLQGSGGVIKQDIDVRTMDSDKIFVTDAFSGSQELDIYQKDGYVPASDSREGIGLVLASTNGGGTFTAKYYEGTLFHTHYDLGSQASATSGFATDWYLKQLTKIDPPIAPTTSVETVLSANALNYHTWRTENDKLLQRMGELRNNGEDEHGAWFRVKGSKIGRNGKFGFENKYTAYELGYDELTKNTADVKRYQGVALSYADGSSSYSKGSGDNSSKAISFYNTEIGSKGHYLDVVLKVSNMDNDFTVYDTHSNKITGDFNNTGVALSAEYGRKNALNNGWYIEPQAQFTLGYLGGDSYTASNGIEVSQSGIKSALGRIGFNIGKEVGSKGIVYAKANLLHEFGGGYDVSMRDSSGAVTVSDSFNDTWFEYGIGAAVAMGSNSQLYVDVERSSGSDFKKDWTWNAGARWTF